MSTNEAAQLLGLSLQGIHYRIKKNQLESLKKDGKTFVYVDSSVVDATKTQEVQQEHDKAFENIVKAKDEQIELLKKTIKFLKKQKDKEIERLERNQEKIFNVFQSEVELLKSAFNEMKNIYAIEHKENKESYKEEKPQMEFISLKEFFLFMKKYNKSDSQIKQIVLDRIKNQDKRFIYNRDNKEVIIYKSDFLDLI